MLFLAVGLTWTHAFMFCLVVGQNFYPRAILTFLRTCTPHKSIWASRRCWVAPERQNFEDNNEPSTFARNGHCTWLVKVRMLFYSLSLLILLYFFSRFGPIHVCQSVDPFADWPICTYISSFPSAQYGPMILFMEKRAMITHTQKNTLYIDIRRTHIGCPTSLCSDDIHKETVGI